MVARRPQLAAVCVLCAALIVAACPSPSGSRFPEPHLAVARGLCWHNDLSQWECPDSNLAFSVSSSEVDSIYLTVKTTAGVRHVVSVPRNADALFLTKPAAEQFLVRYYNATDRVKARDLRAHLNENWVDMK